MRAKWIWLPALTVMFGGLLAAPSTAAATPQCTFAPMLPKRISVGQSVVELRAGIKISGDSACPTDFQVSVHLVHGKDDYFLDWDKTQPDVESIYDFEVQPGTYRTTAGDCLAFDADFNELTCNVSSASTVIKFAAHPKISITRKNSKLTFAVRATRWGATSSSTPMTATVRLQRLVNGAWHTVHTGTARGRAGYVWTHTYPKAARYRVVSSETSSAFAGTSKSVRR